jgi:hypothetical protein
VSAPEVIFGEACTWRLRIPAGNGQPETLLEFPPGTTREEAESVLVEAKRLFLEGLS